MKKIVFTICAKNYIGLAGLLGNSIKKFNKDIDFYIFVADELLSSKETMELANNVLIAKDVLEISKETWNQMSFKYDLTEFCTSIKPSCFKYIFRIFNSSNCIYLDPDILMFESLDCIFELLDCKSIILTPHITSMEEVYTGNLNEQNLLFSGMFNLGFIALRRDEKTLKMLNWWESRLKDRCYRSLMENYFTDQKWIDFLPSFFPSELLISFHLGLNVAPWNFHEREIVIKNNSFFVRNRLQKENATLYPLIFMHFSGFDYNKLITDNIYNGNMKNLQIQPDLLDIFHEYSAMLRSSSFSKYFNLKYSYNYFSNGKYISLIYRKLYRRLLDDGKILSNPFESGDQFYLSLKRSGFIKREMINLDKSTIENTKNVKNRTSLINKFFYILFKFLGVKNFFKLTKLMRLYSKTENHVYLIDKSYFKDFTIRH